MQSQALVQALGAVIHGMKKHMGASKFEKRHAMRLVRGSQGLAKSQSEKPPIREWAGMGASLISIHFVGRVCLGVPSLFILGLWFHLAS